jgi:hypothetical protein
MQTGHRNSHNINSVKLVYTSHGRKIRWNKKDTRCVNYSLIAVHEEAGDECAHARIIINKFRLRYRDTSLLSSSETTRALPKTESWVAAWLEFFFRSTLSFSLTSGMKTEERLARRGTEQMGETL